MAQRHVNTPVRFNVDKGGLPSGHAMHLGTLAAAATRMAPQRTGLIWSYALVLAGARILRLAHNLTDVIVGRLLDPAIDGIVAGRLALRT